MKRNHEQVDTEATILEQVNQFKSPGQFYQILQNSNSDIEIAQSAIEKYLNELWEDHFDDQTNLANLINDLISYLNDRHESFTDCLFPPNVSALVNNHRKSTLDWRNSDFERSSELFEPPSLLEKFDPKDLFNFKGVLPNLSYVLSAFCENPDRIKFLFVNPVYNKEGVYLMRVFQRGWWKPVLVDDFVPSNDERIP